MADKPDTRCATSGYVPVADRWRRDPATHLSLDDAVSAAQRDKGQW
jgi:hypothetical protein